MAECLSQTHTEEAAAALKASLPLVPLKSSLEICSEIGRKKNKKTHINRAQSASSQALPRATSPSDRADAPWMALSWLQAFAALFRDPSAPIKDTPSPQPVQERGWACAPQPLLGTVSPSVSFLCCTFTESAVHNGKPRGYVVHVTGCPQ